MNENDILKTIKRFKTKRKALSIIFVLALIAAIFIPRNFALKIVFALLILFAAIIYLFAEISSINRILTMELDPEKYYALTHEIGYVTKYALEDIETAYMIGDYKKAVNLCLNNIEKTKNDGERASVLFYLCLSCFESGDFEKLNSYALEYKKLAAGFKPNSIANRIQLPQIEFAQSFAAGDFEKGIEFLRNFQPDKISRSFTCRNDLYCALAHYYLGETAKAKDLFEKTESACPKLNYSRIARKYIQAIENGCFIEYSGNNIELQQENSTQFPDSAAPKTAASKKGIIIVFALLIVCLFVCSYFINSENNNVGTAYEIISENDDIKAAGKIIPVENSENVLCLFESSADDEIGIACLVNKDNDIYSYGISNTVNVDDDSIYHIKAGDSDLDISFRITSSEPDKYKETYPVISGNKQYYFSIISAEPKRCTGYTWYCK